MKRWQKADMLNFLYTEQISEDINEYFSWYSIVDIVRTSWSYLTTFVLQIAVALKTG